MLGWAATVEHSAGRNITSEHFKRLLKRFCSFEAAAHCDFFA